MTTIVTTLVYDTLLSNRVFVDRLAGSNPAPVIFDCSNSSTSTTTTIAIGPSNGTKFLVSNMVDGVNEFCRTNLDNFIVDLLTGTVSVNGMSLNSIPSTAQIMNPLFTIGNSQVLFECPITSGNVSNQLDINTSNGASIDLTFPSATGTIAGYDIPNTFTATQNFSIGFLSNTITGSNINGNISLLGNGTGSTTTFNTQIQQGITANTLNADLHLSGNGTGAVAFDTNGIKFASGVSVLKDYTVGTFTTQFTCGTFTSATINIRFQRIGLRVILKVPSVTGTPNVDSVGPPVVYQQIYNQLQFKLIPVVLE